MKWFAVIGAVVFVVLAASCASTPSHGLPGFYLNPPVADDVIYGVGSSSLSNMDNARRRAVGSAREDIAFQMSAVIEAAMINYYQEAGVDGGSQVIEFSEDISRQITDTVLEGTRVEQVELGEDGTVYALVSYPVGGFTEAAATAFARNEDAAFAEFKAEQALDYLDRMLEEQPPRSGQSR